MAFIDVVRGPEKTPQTFANHSRLVPMYHFVTFSCTLVFFVTSLINLLANLNIFGASVLMGLFFVGNVVGSFALVATLFYARVFALRVQDRVIRLEETMRMQRIIADDLKGRIGELNSDQLVALRFASDAELSDLVKQTLDEKLSNPQIKGRIKEWRPDYLRV